MDRIEISQLSEFDGAFGRLGTNVGPRTGSAKRTQDAKEWFVLRHFLANALRAGLFNLPIVISKAEPPEPDFVAAYGIEHKEALIEITEATHPDDQREMTEFEKSSKMVMLLGDFGGRFADGASQPKIVWASDISDAIFRKQNKSICSLCIPDRHLIIYPNSNASQLIFDETDEHTAFAHLKGMIERKRLRYIDALNGCQVHILGKTLVCFDLVGAFSLTVRVAHNLT